MPTEKIAKTHIDNGPDNSYDHELSIRWGAKGGAPEAPDGWVNAGYAHLGVVRLDGKTDGVNNYVVLNASEMDHLIRTLKRIRRKTFEA